MKIIIGDCDKLKIQGKCLEQYLAHRRHSMHFSVAVVVITITKHLGGKNQVLIHPVSLGTYCSACYEKNQQLFYAELTPCTHHPRKPFLRAGQFP